MKVLSSTTTSQQPEAKYYFTGHHQTLKSVSSSEPSQRDSSVLEVPSERTSLSKEAPNSAEVRHIFTTLTTVGLSKSRESSDGGAISIALTTLSASGANAIYVGDAYASIDWTTIEITTLPPTTIHPDPQTTQPTRSAPIPFSDRDHITDALISYIPASSTSAGLVSSVQDIVWAMRYPSSLPKIITKDNINNKNAGFNGSTPSRSDLAWLQVYFKQPLNFAFVVDHPQSAAQIFENLPAALALAGHGRRNGSENDIDVRSLRPCDTRREYGFITTVADVLVPVDRKATLANLIRMDRLGAEQAESPHVGAILSLISSDAEHICGGGGMSSIAVGWSRNGLYSAEDHWSFHVVTAASMGMLLYVGLLAVSIYVLRTVRRSRKPRRTGKTTKRD